MQMNSDFDKEMDTILRKAQRDGPVLVGDVVGSHHLDADEISAFAENATPERSKVLYMAHLSECDRCRKILANLLILNAEAAPAAASPSVITIAERAIPWYRRLLLFPNLAYVMGGLVLIFSGFLAFNIIRNSDTGGSATVSQAVETTGAQGGPNFQDDTVAPEMFSANSTANMANSNTLSTATANTNASSRSEVGAGRGPLAEAEISRDDRNFAIDGTDVTAPAATPPPPAAPASKPALKDSFAKERDEAKTAKVENQTGAQPLDMAKNDAALRQQQSPGVATQSGPMRNNELQYNRQLENLENRAKAKRAQRTDADGGSGRKVVGGRTFERKENVWYDTAYQGRPTINVRRGTDEFNRLDGGLRSIATSLSGTIVVVWGAKAYRIQ